MGAARTTVLIDSAWGQQSLDVVDTPEEILIQIGAARTGDPAGE